MKPDTVLDPPLVTPLHDLTATGNAGTTAESFAARQPFSNSNSSVVAAWVQLSAGARRQGGSHRSSCAFDEPQPAMRRQCCSFSTARCAWSPPPPCGATALSQSYSADANDDIASGNSPAREWHHPAGGESQGRQGHCE